MLLTTEPLVPKPWHAKAIEMTSQGYTRLQIADALDRDIKDIKLLMSPGYRAGHRKRARERGRRLWADPVWRENFNAKRRKKAAEEKRRLEHDAAK